MNDRPPKVRVRIASAQDLARALRSPDASLVAAVVSVVSRRPEAAKAFGAYGSKDVVDEVIAASHRFRGNPLDRVLTDALVALDDPRARDELLRRWRTLDHTPTLAAAARGLTEQDPTRADQFLGPWLMQNASRAHARAVASAWTERAELGDAERVRRAVALPGQVDVPGCQDERVRTAWVRELLGPFAGETRALLEGQGAGAVRAVVEAWPDLDDESRAWLLRWGVQAAPLEVLRPIQDVLTGGNDRLAEVALKALAQLDDGVRGMFQPLVDQCLDRHDPRLRRAAVGAGGSMTSLVDRFADEPDPTVRSAWVRRAGAEEHPAALPVLASALEDPSWRVRSAASRALRELGETAVLVARERATSAHDGTRAAAAQVLMAAGDDEWMERALLS